MSINKKWMIIVLLGLGLLSGQAKKLQAAEAQDVTTKTGFYYKIDYPKNQIGKDQGISLRLKPNEKQTVPVSLINTSDQEMTVKLSVNGARTNEVGEIEIGPNKNEPDRSLEYDLSELVKTPSEVKLAPKETKKFDVTITMPPEKFRGIVTGGVQMIDKNQEEATEGITNKFAFLFGIVLQMTEEEVQPKLILNQVYASQSNYSNAIRTEICNVTPVEMSGLLYEAEITKKDGDEVLYSEKNDHVEMAPNSKMGYPISLDGEEFVPGRYTAYVTMSNDVKEWKWRKDFTISSDQAKRLNAKDVSIVYPKGPDWKKIMLIGLIVVMLIAIVILLIFYRKSQQSEQREKK